jgi:enamine deaminase RidA (YjgF/YER057c/UK114 family)
MALGDQIGVDAAKELTTGATSAVNALASATDKLATTLGSDVADAVSDIVGATDRLNKTIAERSAAWEAIVTRALNLAERGVTVKLGPEAQ